MISQFTVFAGTYNCNQRPATKVDLKDWICSSIDHDLIDIYIFSFQELTTVDNVSENPPPIDLSNFPIWNDGTLEFINTHRKNSKVEKLWDGRLGGTMFASFVRVNFRDQIKNIKTMQVECGRSKTTIKGAICMKFDINGATISLASAHLTADQEQDNYEIRVKDFHTISDSNFPDGVCFNNHDFVCWAGDLNFRVNADRHLIAELSEKKNYDEILKYDQLRLAQSSKKAFTDFFEPPITFPPTYKYIRGTNQFSLTEPPEKRSPAYTDRILYHNSNKLQVKVNQYSMGGLIASDHKPVNALFTIIPR